MDQNNKVLLGQESVALVWYLWLKALEVLQSSKCGELALSCIYMILHQSQGCSMVEPSRAQARKISNGELGSGESRGLKQRRKIKGDSTATPNPDPLLKYNSLAHWCHLGCCSLKTVEARVSSLIQPHNRNHATPLGVLSLSCLLWLHHCRGTWLNTLSSILCHSYVCTYMHACTHTYTHMYIVSCRTMATLKDNNRSLFWGLIAGFSGLLRGGSFVPFSHCSPSSCQLSP